MGYRKIALVNGELYHVYSKSIAEYKIFRNKKDFLRMEGLIRYYRFEQEIRFSDYQKIVKKDENFLSGNEIVEIITYCFMPTHIHFILLQLQNNGISKFMERVLKSYAVYFNNKYKRKGPLWSGKFSNVLIETDEQLLHLTRYIHLNPVTAYIVEKPEDWEFSSYREYIGKKENPICKWEKYLDINIESYKKFVLERKDYQRELARIKHLLLE